MRNRKYNNEQVAIIVLALLSGVLALYVNLTSPRYTGSFGGPTSAGQYSVDKIDSWLLDTNQKALYWYDSKKYTREEMQSLLQEKRR